MKEIISESGIDSLDETVHIKTDYIIDFMDEEEAEIVLGKERFETINKFLDYYENCDELDPDYVDQCFCIVYFVNKDNKRIHIATLSTIMFRHMSKNPDYNVIYPKVKQDYKYIFPCDDEILGKAIAIFWPYFLNQKYGSNIIDGNDAKIKMPTFRCGHSEKIMPIIHKIESESFLNDSELDIIKNNKCAVFKLLHFRRFCYLSDERPRYNLSPMAQSIQ